MDPRTAAKVTAPDLVKAFNEGRGSEDGSEPVEPRAWVAFFSVDRIVDRVVEYPLDQLTVALEDVRVHLAAVEGNAVLITTGLEPDEFVATMQHELSESEG